MREWESERVREWESERVRERENILKKCKRDREKQKDSKEITGGKEWESERVREKESEKANERESDWNIEDILKRENILSTCCFI